MTELKHDLTGKKFGRLTVIKRQPLSESRTRTTVYWTCLCDCGKSTVARSYELRNLSHRSCGCLIPDTNKLIFRKGTKNIPGAYIAARKNSAKRRNLNFTVSDEYLQKLLESQNFICPLTGRELIMCWDRKKNTASLDRIDSSKGYEEGNLQWIHVDANIAKNDLSMSDFVKLCEDIVNHRRAEKDEV